MRTHRVWIEIVIFATVSACAVALLIATLGAVAASAAGIRQANEDRGSVSPRPQASDKPSLSPDDRTSSTEDPQTLDAHSFTGRVTELGGEVILNDPVAKVKYHFDDQAKARQYLGKQVRVTGKLDLNSNTIHINEIAPI